MRHLNFPPRGEGGGPSFHAGLPLNPRILKKIMNVEADNMFKEAEWSTHLPQNLPLFLCIKDLFIQIYKLLYSLEKFLTF